MDEWLKEAQKELMRLELWGPWWVFAGGSGIQPTMAAELQERKKERKNERVKGRNNESWREM